MAGAYYILVKRDLFVKKLLGPGLLEHDPLLHIWCKALVLGPRMVEFTLFTKPAMCNATKKQEIRVRVTIEEI